jgi:hypothetical protein
VSRAKAIREGSFGGAQGGGTKGLPGPRPTRLVKGAPKTVLGTLAVHVVDSYQEQGLENKININNELLN